MRLIVGLGNPGPEYEFTPHNMGFLAVDVLGGRAGIRVTRPEASQAADDDESERCGGADATRAV
jgi:peptidyl-tRNA hydrolase